MKKILSYGISVDQNFGGLSLIAGLTESLKSIYGEGGFSLIHYQWNKPSKENECILESNIKKLPYSGVGVIKDWVKFKIFRRAPEQLAKAEFWNDFNSSDIVYNVYGICFCAKLKSRMGRLKLFAGFRSAISGFAISVIAKLEGKTSVKGAASYGPITSAVEKDAARLAAGLIFDRMLAREEESALQMRTQARVKKPIPVAPDIANMMPCSVNWTDCGPIGFSVCFQIIKQWEGTDEYIGLMARLINYVHKSTGRDVVIFPNELKWNNDYDDDAVAKEIMNRVSDKDGWLSICNTRDFSGLALKNLIAGCTVVISARYHSCVAALSAGVPVLVIGWHYKYTELLALYGQPHRMVSTKASTFDKLKTEFDDMWKNRIEVHELLCQRAHDVRCHVVNSQKYLLGIG